jgi:hypothetical protein
MSSESETVLKSTQVNPYIEQSLPSQKVSTILTVQSQLNSVSVPAMSQSAS